MLTTARATLVLAFALCGGLWATQAQAQAQAQPTLRVAPPPGGTSPATSPAASPAPVAAPTAPAASPSPGPAAPTPSASPATSPNTPTASPLSLLDAVRTTLRNHPALAAAAAETRARRAELGLSEAPFEPLFTSSLGHRRDVEPLLPGSLHDDTTTFELGLAKRFALGTTVLPSVALSRLHQRTRPPLPGMAGDPRQRASAELTVIQPLLRGAGATAAASEVRAAQRSVRAAEHLEGHTAQAQVLETIQRYFLLAASEQEISLLRASRDRARTLVEETRVLVEADQRPRGDLRQLEGNLATREHALLEADTSRAQALYDLNLAMGLDQDAPDVRPSDGYPLAASMPTSPTSPTPLTPNALAAQALLARRDVQAAEEALAASSASLEGQERNTLPALDLSVSVGYVGAVADDGVGPFFSAAGENVEGVNAGASLSLELPLGNTERQAARDLASARRASAEIARDDLARNVRIEVRRALSELRLNERALVAARAAEASYAQALADERDKLRAGLSTVIDVVLTEELSTQAQLARLRNELTLALALARLRFVQGTLPARETGLGGSAEALLSGAGEGSRGTGR